MSIAIAVAVTIAIIATIVLGQGASGSIRA
jgi:hypothetical protein